MTTPYERYRAIERTRDFLYSLIDPKKTPRIPKKTRLLASILLRHYPQSYYMELAADKLPDIFDKDQTWYLNKFQDPNNEK